MHLTKVFIYSNMTAQRAQDKINKLIEEYGDVDNTVNFDLQIENSVAAGKYSETRYTLASGVKVTAIKGFHDDVHGSKRGETLLFLLETEGLRIVHLGDLGCPLTAEQTEILSRPDILMIPVGGYYTIDGKTAAQTAETLRARTVLPMHYKTRYNADWPISGPEAFLEAFSGETVRKNIEILRVTEKDLECQPSVAIFKA